MESIATKEDVLRIVDVYQARWMIEEYFKALETGCAYETLQLESYSTLLVCMTLFVPIAWLMLRMHAKSRKAEPISVGQNNVAQTAVAMDDHDDNAEHESEFRTASMHQAPPFLRKKFLAQFASLIKKRI